MTGPARTRPGRTGITAVLLVIVLCIVHVTGWYLLPAFRATDVRARAQQLSADVGALQLGDIDREAVAALRARVDALRADMGWFRAFLSRDPLISIGDRLGLTGSFVHDGSLLLAAGDDVTRAATVALDLADRFVALREQPGVSGQQLLAGLVELMATSTAEVDEAAAYVTQAREKLAGIPGGAQSDIRSAADTMIAALDRYAPLLVQLRELDEVLPGIVGRGDSKRYLVLAQDPAELRPTGGYVGTVGIVRFTDGVMVERSFEDVFHYDLRPGIPFVEPPEALASHLLGTFSWQLADANWSPDFPTSAQDALRLYTLESGDADIDGVLALTTDAVDRLLELTGPVEVPSYGVTVAAGEVTLTALRHTRGVSTPGSDRKAFLDDLATAVIERLYALPPDAWPALFDAFRDMADERTLQAWFKDPVAQAVVAGAPVGGAVRQDAGDFLYVVEANVAPPSKYNLVVDRQDRLEVTLAADGAASSVLHAAWQNRAMTEGEPYAAIRSYSRNKSGFYGTYTRVLTPVSSTLVSASGNAIDPIDGVESISSEAGRAAFGTFLLIGPDGADLNVAWTTPGAATQANGVWTYVLTIQKQPGLRPLPVEVSVTLPAGAQVANTSAGTTLSGGTATFGATLERDARVEIRYVLP